MIIVVEKEETSEYFRITCHIVTRHLATWIPHYMISTWNPINSKPVLRIEEVEILNLSSVDLATNSTSKQAKRDALRVNIFVREKTTRESTHTHTHIQTGDKSMAMCLETDKRVFEGTHTRAPMYTKSCSNTSKIVKQWRVRENLSRTSWIRLRANTDDFAQIHTYT